MTTLAIKGVEPKVLEILGGNPTLSYSIIAGEVGVTRERVRQIARRNGYPPRNGVLKQKICPVCGDAYYTKNLYCSSSCRYQANLKRVVINCHHCGQPVERTPGNMRSKSGRYFCNRGCFSRWMSKRHSRHPKERRHLAGDFEYEVGSRDELVRAPQICTTRRSEPKAKNLGTHGSLRY
ncbi:hypothetical protein ACFLW2_02000 [Chloroflexota bacterium]